MGAAGNATSDIRRPSEVGLEALVGEASRATRPDGSIRDDSSRADVKDVVARSEGLQARAERLICGKRYVAGEDRPPPEQRASVALFT